MKILFVTAFLIAGATIAQLVCVEIPRAISDWLTRPPRKPADPLANLSEDVIRKLAELEEEFPTEDPVSLAAVKWVKDRERKASIPISGAYQQMLGMGLNSHLERQYQQSLAQQMQQTDFNRQRALMQQGMAHGLQNPFGGLGKPRDPQS